MDRTKVNSSTVLSAGYDEVTHTLEIEFASGGVYQYEGVPKETFEAFMRAESKGHFFQVDIRPSYVCVRLHFQTCGAPRGETCAGECSCWCHRQRKDVTNAEATKKDSEEASASGKAQKKKRLA